MKHLLPWGTLGLLLLLCLNSRAQDPIYSQFFANPMYLNPALTGLYGGVNYFSSHQQLRYKAGPFVSHHMGASWDVPCIQSAFGLILGNTRTGEAPVNWRQLGLTYAWYAMPGDGNDPWDLRLGLKGTYNQRTLDPNGLIFSDQLHAIYGVTGASGMDFSAYGGDKSFFDLGAGVDVTVAGKFTHAMGLAVDHLVRADNSLLNLDDTLAMRFTGYWQGAWEVDYDQRRTYWVVPVVKFDMQRASRRWSQQDSTGQRIRYLPENLRRLTYGVIFALQQNKEAVGAWGGLLMHTRQLYPDLQHVNSLSLVFGFSFISGNTDWRIGGSYDYDYSGTRSDGGGIFELGLTMIFNGENAFCSNFNRNRYRRRCPVPGMRSSGFTSANHNYLNFR